MVKLPPEETLRGTDGPQTGLPAAQELLPCPFCGGRASLINGGPGNVFIKCNICLACSDDGLAERITKSWNRRTPPADPLAQRAATAGGVAPTLSGADGEIARLREALDDSELTRAFEILDNYIENGTNPLVALGLIGKALLAWADVRKRALGAP
jgi:hypothetical protein